MVAENPHLTPQTLAKQWDDYAERAVPADAPPIVRELMRHAFFAGAQSLLTALTQAQHTMPKAMAAQFAKRIQFEITAWIAAQRITAQRQKADG